MESIISVKESILDEFRKIPYVFDEEKISMFTPVEYSFNDNSKYVSGYFVLTIGTIYILKKNLKLHDEISILEIKSLNLENSNLFLEYRENSFSLRLQFFENAEDATERIIISLNETMFNIEDENFKIDINTDSLPIPKISSRRNDSLKKRVITLSHYYKIHSKPLFDFSYFDKWENSINKTTLQITSLRLGNFAAAIGHAIAWESTIQNLTLSAFLPIQLDDFLYSLLSHTRSLKTLTFTDYSSKLEKYISDTSDTEISEPPPEIRTNLQIIFSRCSHRCLDHLLRQLRSAIFPQMALINMRIDSDQMLEIIDRLKQYYILHHVSKLKLAKFDFSDCSISLARNFFSSFNHLKCLYFNGSNEHTKDGSFVFSSLCSSSAKPYWVILNNLTFNTPIASNCTLLSSISVLDVSTCEFNSVGLKSFLEFLTFDRSKFPLILIARNLKINEDSYEMLSEIEFEQCYPNIVEFIWDNNMIPSQSSQFLFAFLYTQKNLRLVSFRNNTTDDSTQLLKDIIKLSHGLKISGIEIEGDFDNFIFIQFIQSLIVLRNLKFLVLGNVNGGDKELQALESIVNELKINEIGIYGFENKTFKELTEFMDRVKKAKTTIALDIQNPSIDEMKISKKNSEKNEKMKESLLNDYEKLKRVLKTNKRIFYHMQCQKEGKLPKPEVFFDSIRTNYNVKSAI